MAKELKNFLKLKNNNMIHSIINKTIDMSEILKNIKEVIEYKNLMNETNVMNNRIIEELLYLGYDISHKGTQYLIRTIFYIINNSILNIENLEKNIYPKIASLYNDSVHNVKCRINNATTVMYCNCEIEKLKKYFNFNLDTKPKVKTVINTVIRKIL